MFDEEQNSGKIHKGNIVYISICIIILLILRILFPQTQETRIEKFLPELLQTMWSEVDMHRSVMDFFYGLTTDNAEAVGTLLFSLFQYIYISRFINRAVKTASAVDKLLYFLGGCLLQIILSLFWAVNSVENRSVMMIYLSCCLAIQIAISGFLCLIHVFFSGEQHKIIKFLEWFFKSTISRLYYSVVLGDLIGAGVYGGIMCFIVYFQPNIYFMVVLSMIFTCLWGKVNNRITDRIIESAPQYGRFVDRTAMFYLVLLFALWVMTAVMGMTLPYSKEIFTLLNQIW